MAGAETNRTYDELLILLIRGGDRRASERLAARWYPRLLRTARRLLGDADLAQETVQECWIAIIRGLPRLLDPARFPAWAFSILHRKCADAIKRAVRDREQFRPSAVGAEASIDASGETRTALDQAFALLSQEHRAAAILFFGEGLSLAEIATATDVPLGTAKSRIFHARQHLKAALEGDKP
ncbi:MAG: RNA polymerase sigma factor [Pseudomonadota bacterium]